MSDLLSPAAARRAFLLLTVARWFPVGLVVGIFTLWFVERGLTVAQTLLAFSLTGIVVFVLELPTGGFADALGRRPVLIAAAAVNIVAGAVLIWAPAFWAFALGAALQGVFRALDSGPLEAWYVDTVHATEPGADVDQTLATEGTVMGASMAIGAVVSGGLVAWHPLSSGTALLLPMVCWVSLNAVYLLAIVLLMREPRTHVDTTGLRRAAVSAREAPGVIRDGFSLLHHNRVLLSLVLVEVFWTAALVVFETFQPLRLAELVGGEEQAGALMGPVAAVGWGVFALGSALAGFASGRIGVARTAILARVLNGLGAVTMGLVAGPVALIAAYLLTYGLHGTGEPMHSSLLHREAQARNRATVLSMNSMVFFISFALLGPPLGLLAGATSTQVAMVTAGAFSILGAFLYLPALRAERARPVAVPS
ncbi:MFS transporter [Nocardioides euryhalodurans]|uniref:MFS transporter n=1 Tax=Nocardioides euryhalodurans TaxID=2518370 RepID=A0A4P7GNY3_9ACTN|nr:MFS transporter [Nocardioides euryhalodurans]QBR93935.1 MFS transporter [Nocardioides euryhalodurans]